MLHFKIWAAIGTDLLTFFLVCSMSGGGGLPFPPWLHDKTLLEVLLC